jgi:hypothetical protein
MQWLVGSSRDLGLGHDLWGNMGARTNLKTPKRRKLVAWGKLRWEDRGPHGSPEPMPTPEENMITGADPRCTVFTREHKSRPSNSCRRADYEESVAAMREQTGFPMENKHVSRARRSTVD